MDFEALDRQIIGCRKCPRLVSWREEVALRKRQAFSDWDYWGKPVPGFGDPHARVLVVGLAPGAHGSNRTGRQFTGDASGRFLYPALFRAGFADRPDSLRRDDGLVLSDVFLTAVCRCAPPGNKPGPDELAKCQPYLVQELDWIRPRVVVCLGRIAFAQVLKVLSLRAAAHEFVHGASYRVAAPAMHLDAWLLCSYHPSQQNTLTGRLSVTMFDQIWAKARELMHDAPPSATR
jgi:uracil-DNA glycosylase family 4